MIYRTFLSLLLSKMFIKPCNYLLFSALALPDLNRRAGTARSGLEREKNIRRDCDNVEVRHHPNVENFRSWGAPWA